MRSSLSFWPSKAAFRGKGGGLDQGAPLGPVAKRRQRIDRGCCITAGARQGLGQRPAPFDETDCLFEIARPLVQLLDRTLPKCSLLFVAAREGEKDRQGDLAVAEIVADGFAKLAGKRREVEHVVDQLEGDPEIAPKAVERLLFLGRPLGHHSA